MTKLNLIQKLDKDGFIIVKSKKIKKLKDQIKNELAKNIIYIFGRNKILNKKKFDDLLKYALMVDKKQNTNILKSLYELFPSNLFFYSLPCNNFFTTLCIKLGIKKPVISTGPQIRIDRPKDKKFKTLKHQDFWYSFLSNNSLTIWFNLTNIREQDGPLKIYKHSHKSGLLKFVDKKKGTLEIKNSITTKKNTIYLKSDEILIFNQFLVHESGVNNSSKPRVTIQLRYNDFFTIQKFTSSFKFASTKYVTNKQKCL